MKAPLDQILSADEIASGSADGSGLDYRTKVDVAYEQLRRWILTGRLKPGERLDQAWLARHMRVSRTPLRQALLRLASERLIDASEAAAQLRRQNFFDLTFIEDLYQSRRALESMLAEAAATRLTETTVKHMQEVLDMQELAVKTGDPDRFTELDREFHFALYRAAGYARAYDMIQELRDSSERYVRFYAVYKDGAAESLVEHRRILQLCVEHDIAGVRHEVEHHVMRGLETLRTIASELA